MNAIVKDNARQEIAKAIADNNLSKLLLFSGLLHGHFCPYSAIGVKAAARAVRELGVKSTGMEETIAIVETNNCFSDGVQLITGCSFGNNALIYRDYGKTAFTLAKRSGEAIRMAVKADSRFLEEREPEAMALFQKVVKERAGTAEDEKRLKEMWCELSFKLLEVSDEVLFDIRRMRIEVPAYARIFAGVKCSICGENVMKPRARLKDGKPVCIPCSGQEFYQLAGDGISVITP
ncbi:MAG: TraR/DksA C4-type zinc finger protein [Dehalococcoidia bacterium]|nr:TraR/DksA C4-type zinc finger protein [Dehalococcoidia bacterium]